MDIDSLDRQIISVTQAGLPLTPQPYQTIADDLGVSAELLMQRMTVMQQQGIILGCRKVTFRLS